MAARGIKSFKKRPACCLFWYANNNLKQQWEEWSAAWFENVCAPAGFSISKRTLRPARSFELRRRVFSFRPNRPYRSLFHVLTRSRDESPRSGDGFEPV